MIHRGTTMFLQLVDFDNLVERRTRKIRPFRYVNVQSNNIFLEKVYTYAFHTNCESLFISRSAICGDQFKYIRFFDWIKQTHLQCQQNIRSTIDVKTIIHRI